jgi:hypothetical protein
VALSAGRDDAVAGLERSLAVGADRAVLVLLDGLDPDSLSVAGALAWGMESAGLADPLVVCGDYSADRGSGTVPAALAALTGLPQALGLVWPCWLSLLRMASMVPSPARIRVQRRPMAHAARCWFTGGGVGRRLGGPAAAGALGSTLGADRVRVGAWPPRPTCGQAPAGVGRWARPRRVPR